MSRFRQVRSKKELDDLISAVTKDKKKIKEEIDDTVVGKEFSKQQNAVSQAPVLAGLEGVAKRIEEIFNPAVTEELVGGKPELGTRIKKTPGGDIVRINKIQQLLVDNTALSNEIKKAVTENKDKVVEGLQLNDAKLSRLVGIAAMSQSSLTQTATATAALEKILNDNFKNVTDTLSRMPPELAKITIDSIGSTINITELEKQKAKIEAKLKLQTQSDLEKAELQKQLDEAEKQKAEILAKMKAQADASKLPPPPPPDASSGSTSSTPSKSPIVPDFDGDIFDLPDEPFYSPEPTPVTTKFGSPSTPSSPYHAAPTTTAGTSTVSSTTVSTITPNLGSAKDVENEKEKEQEKVSKDAASESTKLFDDPTEESEAIDQDKEKTKKKILDKIDVINKYVNNNPQLQSTINSLVSKSGKLPNSLKDLLDDKSRINFAVELSQKKMDKTKNIDGSYSLKSADRIIRQYLNGFIKSVQNPEDWDISNKEVISDSTDDEETKKQNEEKQQRYKAKQESYIASAENLLEKLHSANNILIFDKVAEVLGFKDFNNMNKNDKESSIIHSVQLAINSPDNKRKTLKKLFENMVEISKLQNLPNPTPAQKRFKKSPSKTSKTQTPSKAAPPKSSSSSSSSKSKKLPPPTGMGILGVSIKYPSGYDPYRMTGTGAFGKLQISMKDLDDNHLRVYKDGKQIAYQPIEQDLKDLLTKRFSKLKKYNPESVAVFQKLVKHGEIPAYDKLSKYQTLLKDFYEKEILPHLSQQGQGCECEDYDSEEEDEIQPSKKGSRVKIFKDVDDVANRLQILIGEMSAGNDSTSVLDEASELINFLKKGDHISDEDEKLLMKASGLI